jgi:hypothetical protein
MLAEPHEVLAALEALGAILVGLGIDAQLSPLTARRGEDDVAALELFVAVHAAPELGAGSEREVQIAAVLARTQDQVVELFAVVVRAPHTQVKRAPA